MSNISLAIIGCVFLVCALILFLSVTSGSKGVPAKEPVVETPSGWTATPDLLANDPHVSAYVITDPHGKKFMLARMRGYSGIGVVPYEAGK